MKSELIIEIDGFKLKTNSIYKVVNKPDADAPSGLKALGTTKIPSDGVQDVAGCRYDVKKNKWDHGFNTNCPCYSGKEPREAQALVDILNEKIAQPYANTYVNSDQLIVTNSADEFWENYSYNLEDGKIFKTSDVKDLFDLYIALRSYSLTPSNKKGSPKYRNSAYMIVDNNLAVEHKKSQNTLKIDAITEFGILLKTDKTKLLHVLYYMGHTFQEDASDIDLKNIFATLTDSPENVEYFMKVVEQSDKEGGEERLYLYRKLMDSYKRDTGVKKLPNGSFVYKDTEIGAELKTAAQRISIEEDFSSIKKEILLGSDD